VDSELWFGADDADRVAMLIRDREGLALRIGVPADGVESEVRLSDGQASALLRALSLDEGVRRG
jgi:hypothetical protein